MPAWFHELFFGPGPISFVQHTLGLGWPFPFRVVGLLGVSWGVLLAAGLALWLWGRRAVYALVAIVVLEALVSMAMNRIFSVERPDAPSIVRYEYIEMGSFPSGHLFTATVVWGWMYAAGHLRFAVAATAILLVAISRMYLGVHFLGDVVGAAVFGAALVWIHAKTWPRVERWLADRPPAFFAVLAAGFAAAGLAAVLVIFPGNPYVANAAGVLVAGGAALWAEQRWLDHAPPPRGRRARLSVVGLGLAGMLPPLVVWWMVDERAPAVSAVMTGVATLWALFATPLLARRLPLARAAG